MALADLVTSVNSKVRFVDLKLDLSGAYKAYKNYLKFKDEVDYATKYQSIYPYAPKFVGTGATVVFTPTVSPVWSVDQLKDKYAIFFKLADVTTAITGGDLSAIRGVSYQIQKIVSNTATAVTVGSNVLTGATDMIVMDSDGFTIANLKDYSLTDTAATIEDNHHDTNGYKNTLLGIKDGDITGVSGSYFIALHTHFQLQMAKDSGLPVELRAGNSLNEDEMIFFGTYLLNEFNKTGTIDGSAITQYSGNFLLTGTPTKKYVTTAGVKPSF